MAYYYGKAGDATGLLPRTQVGSRGGGGGGQPGLTPRLQEYGDAPPIVPPDGDEEALCSDKKRICYEACDRVETGEQSRADCKLRCDQDYQNCIGEIGDGDEEEPGTCGTGAGPAYDGCPCGKYYVLVNNDDACQAGYYKFPHPATDGYRCECGKWCNDIGYGADCQSSPTAAKEQMGEFKWPQEISDIYKRLLGRQSEVLDMPYGWSDEAMANMFGRDFEKLRESQRGTRQSLTETLGREGMQGTGQSLKAFQDLGWMGEKGISDITRDLFTSGELQKKKDVQDFSRLASDLFQQSMGYQQIMEAINAARRGEGLMSMQLLLQLLSQMGQVS